MTPPEPAEWASPTTSLDNLQQWLLSAITSPSEIDAAELASTLLPSHHQSVADRLAVYQHAYQARLVEVLRELFPCTRFAVGDDLFDQFVAGYLAAHPPHSYTLSHLADHWVDYLDSSRPAGWGQFVVELARLEHAIDRIFDGPGPEGLQPFTIPSGADSTLRVAFVPGFELLAFLYPASSFYTEWKAGGQPKWPDERQQFVALLRRDFIVRRYEVTKPQHDLLLALQCGNSLGAAMVAVSQSLETDVDELAAGVGGWFQFWAEEKFFARAV